MGPARNELLGFANVKLQATSLATIYDGFGVCLFV